MQEPHLRRVAPRGLKTPPAALKPAGVFDYAMQPLIMHAAQRYKDY